MQDLRDLLSTKIKSSLQNLDISSRILNDHETESKIRNAVMPLGLIKSLAEKSEGNFYSENELQFNLRYSTIL